MTGVVRNKKINTQAKHAIDIIVSTWVEKYSDADRPPPEGYSLILPYTGYREVAISLTRDTHLARESLNYLVDWNWYKGVGVHVAGPVPNETAPHELHQIVIDIHSRLIVAGFECGDEWNNYKPPWLGYLGRHLSYKKTMK